MKTQLLSLILVALTLGRVLHAEDSPGPPKLRLERIPYAETLASKPEFLFTLGGFGYRTVGELKRGIERLQKGTEIRWQPSCIVFGGEPLSTRKEIDELLALCKSRGIVFIIIPSG